jgi:hypothetical protein
MNIWNSYYVENQRRQDEIKQAAQYRMLRSGEAASQSRLTKLSIRILDIVGSKLVQWGKQLQCRCAELSLSSSKRAI